MSGGGKKSYKYKTINMHSVKTNIKTLSGKQYNNSECVSNDTTIWFAFITVHCKIISHVRMLNTFIVDIAKRKNRIAR